MATSVFGTPITALTLRRMDEYKDKPITRTDMAVVAFESKNDGRDVKAREFVEDRRKDYGFHCILCVVYNATGDTITLQTYSDAGRIAPSPHPTVIGNGQWGAFLKKTGGAIVYNAFNGNGKAYQVAYMYRSLEPGRCYTEIRELDHYKPKDKWDIYDAPLKATQSYVYQVHDKGFSSFASIGGSNNSPVFEAIITLENAWSRLLVQNPTLFKRTVTPLEYYEDDTTKAQEDEPDATSTSMEN